MLRAARPLLYYRYELADGAKELLLYQRKKRPAFDKDGGPMQMLAASRLSAGLESDHTVIVRWVGGSLSLVDHSSTPFGYSQGPTPAQSFTLFCQSWEF